MTDRDKWWQISLIAGLLALGYLAVFPLDRNIKLGIDLRGGYSLLYEIDDAGLSQAEKSELSGKVMSILKERVDPNGVLNLVWRPVGHNRLEIQMPRPPQSVADARAAYVAKRDILIDTLIRRGDVMLALSREGADREKAFEGLIKGVPRRKELLTAVGTHYDALRQAESGDDDAALQAAETAYEQAFDALMATNVELGRLEAAVQADPRKVDRETKKPIRQTELEKLRTEHPDVVAMINDTVTAYDNWMSLRGKEGALDDPADLQRLLRGAGVLEFRILAEPDPGDPTAYQQYVDNLKKRGPRMMPGDRLAWFPIENPGYFFKSQNIETDFERVKRRYWIAERYADKYYLLSYVDPSKCLDQNPEAGMAWELKSAIPTRDEEGKPSVAFNLDERGGNRFQKLTSENKGKQLCFFLDGQAVSSATIQSTIRTQGRITGSFTPEEVTQLCQKLNAGSLPRKLKEPPISVRGIGPSLGLANRTAGTNAALVGCVAVAIFMIGYYMYSGVLAVLATAMNLLLTGAVVATLNATMTLPGIAGMVLAVGMSVDANVLINERIREELARGANMKMAIKLGYEKAFGAILDSNLTTILTCAILYWIGTEEIRGFGLTLGWGVVINLLTAVYVTHIFFDYMESPRVPAEWRRMPLYTAGGTAAAGALLYGLGRMLNSPETYSQSTMMFFGKLLMAMLPATAAVLLLLVVMRAVHKGWQAKKPNSLPMLYLVKVPNFDWYGKRKVFFAMSGILTVGLMAVFFMRDAKDVYDIEFLGGTAAQIDLKKPGSLNDKDVRERLAKAGEEIKSLADKVAAAQVTAAGAEFAVGASGAPAARVANILRAQLANFVTQGGIRVDPDRPGEVFVQFKTDVKLPDGSAPSAAALTAQLKLAAQRAREAADQIADAQVQEVMELGASRQLVGSFEIVTRETSRELVVDAIVSSMKDDLDLQPSLTFDLVKDKTRGDEPFFPVMDADLGKVIGTPASESAGDMLGGVAIVLDNVSPPQTLADLEKRLRDMRLQPGHTDVGWRQQRVVGLEAAGSDGGVPTFSRVAILVSDENYVYEEGSELQAAWRSTLAEPEVQLVRDALSRQTSLGKVTQFAPQVATDSKVRAYLALGLSWIMIIAYVWFRFGSIAWGVAAVVALMHDALMALGMIAASYLLAATPIGRWLMIEPFRVDLTIVAALLTIVGYSVNDKIVNFDRIRENRGKLTDITPELLNASINQTFSRTILTGICVIVVILIMYVIGGRAIHGFNYAMLIGCVTGCYSSIAIAVPLLVWLQKRSAPAA